MWLMIMTRPDIANAVRAAARLSQPLKEAPEEDDGGRSPSYLLTKQFHFTIFTISFTYLSAEL